MRKYVTLQSTRCTKAISSVYRQTWQMTCSYIISSWTLQTCLHVVTTVPSVTCNNFVLSEKPVKMMRDQFSSWNLQMAISPSSLQVAMSPASFGFQATQLTSWLWALVTWAASKNTGWSGSDVSSSLNTRTASSPEAVARAPVSRHLSDDEHFWLKISK